MLQCETEGEDVALTVTPVIEAALSALWRARVEPETAALALSDAEGCALPEVEGERETTTGDAVARCVVEGAVLDEDGAEGVASLLAKIALAFELAEGLPELKREKSGVSVPVPKSEGVPYADEAETLAECEALLEGVVL